MATPEEPQSFEEQKDTPHQQEMTEALKRLAAEEVKREAANLAEKQRQKTWGESLFAEYQTRPANIRGTEIGRGDAFRFERGQIFKAYKNLRQEIRQAEAQGEDATPKKSLLKEMRERAKVIERDLDELNRQYYENVREVEVETKFGKFVFPVAELDLRKYQEGENYDPEKDDRVPEIFLTGAVSNFHQTASYSMARALQGHKVYVPMAIEQPSVQKPENFGQLLRERGDLKPYAAGVKGVIKQLGLEKFDLSGWSMGGTVALEVASDPELEGLNNLTVMEPLGLQDKGFWRLGMEFGLSQGLKTLTNAETRIKALDQGAKDSQAGISALADAGVILAKKHFDPETLANINPEGRFQVWIGAESPLMNKDIVQKVFKQTEKLREEKNEENSPLEFYTVKGVDARADHGFPMVNALGLSRMIDGAAPREQFATVKNKDLGNSAAEWMIKDIK